MLIRFWCDSDLTFSRGLHKNLVTVLYFSIINVLCGAGGDASFAPQANLVLTEFVSYLRERGVLCVGNGSHFCKPVLMNMCNITFQVLRLSRPTFVFNKCSKKNSHGFI